MMPTRRLQPIRATRSPTRNSMSTRPRPERLTKFPRRSAEPTNRISTPNPETVPPVNPESSPTAGNPPESQPPPGDQSTQAGEDAPMNSRNSPVAPPPVSVASASSNSPNQVFADLDRDHKGYLSQSDVAAHPFLASNFGKCDTNSDARLSMDEVFGCMRNAPGQH